MLKQLSLKLHGIQHYSMTPLKILKMKYSYFIMITININSANLGGHQAFLLAQTNSFSVFLYKVSHSPDTSNWFKISVLPNTGLPVKLSPSRAWCKRTTLSKNVFQCWKYDKYFAQLSGKAASVIVNFKGCFLGAKMFLTFKMSCHETSDICFEYSRKPNTEGSKQLRMRIPNLVK